MAKDLITYLNNLLDDVQRNSIKTAAPISEAGGLEGGSSHPSAKVEDGNQTATTGARAAENTADVKAQTGKPSVDSTPEATAGSVNQNDHQLNIGTKQSLTGEDPAAEDNYKDKKDEPGNLDGKATTSPATVGDEKFGALALPEKYDELTKLANELLAEVITGNTQAPAAQPAAQPTAEQAAAAAQAGYKVAADAGKPLSDADVHAWLRDQIKTAAEVADHVGSYIASYADAQRKQAMDADDATAAEDHNKPGDNDSGSASDAGDAGDKSPNGGTAEGGLLGGGGDAAGLLGAMGAGPAPEAPAAGGMGGGADPVNELFNALVEMGVTPEQLHALADQMGSVGGPAAGGLLGAGGAPGGLPGGAPGGLPPEMGPKIAAIKQAAHTVKVAALQGKTRICEAKTANQHAMRNQYKEIVGDFVRRACGI